jgi:hypothetical protein
MTGHRSPPPVGLEASDVPEADLEVSLAVDRMLARYAQGTASTPDAGLSDRVMAAIAAEPAPAPIVAVAAAARAHRWNAVLAGLRDLWPVAWSGGRPWVIRTSAAAIVLAGLIGASSVGGLAAVGAWNALSQQRVPVVAPIVSPSPAPSPVPSSTSTPLPSPSANPTSRPTQRPTTRPAEHSATPTPHRTSAPTHHPDPTHAPTPTHHAEPTHSPMPTHHADGG